jgi:hypothetical protein
MLGQSNKLLVLAKMDYILTCVIWSVENVILGQQQEQDLIVNTLINCLIYYKERNNSNSFQPRNDIVRADS